MSSAYVWIVRESCYHESESILGVFDTSAAAHIYAAERGEPEYPCESYEVDKWDIRKSPEGSGEDALRRFHTDEQGRMQMGPKPKPVDTSTRCSMYVEDMLGKRFGHLENGQFVVDHVPSDEVK